LNITPYKSKNFWWLNVYRYHFELFFTLHCSFYSIRELYTVWGFSSHSASLGGAALFIDALTYIFNLLFALFKRSWFAATKIDQKWRIFKFVTKTVESVESWTMCSIAGKFRLVFYSLNEICEGALVASAVGCVLWTGENITIGSCRWWLLLVLFQ